MSDEQAVSTRATLEMIRDNYVEYKTLRLHEVRSLIVLAVNDYDLSGENVADNVETMLTSEVAWEGFIPARGPAARKPRPAPVGPLTRVDAYECEADRLRVEVERVPGTDDVLGGVVGAHVQQEEVAGVVPHCPTCEREMAFVGSKLRRAR